jgi:hypothetical protein
VDSEIAESAETVLYSTLPRLAAAPALSPGPVYDAVRSLLLEASSNPRPEAPGDDGQRIDNAMVSWSGGQPRIEAAKGLMQLARHRRGPDAEVLDAIRPLAADHHWAVRFQVRAHLNWLWDFDRAAMWELIERCEDEESDQRILRSFADMLVRALMTADPDRIDGILSSLAARVEDDAGEDSIGESLAVLVVWRVVRQDHGPSRDRVARWIDQPVVHEGFVRKVVADGRGLMVFDNDQDGAAFSGRVRTWAFESLLTLTNRLISESAALHDRHAGDEGAKWPEDDAAAMHTLWRTADHVANQVYFASGAFNERGSGRAGGDGRDHARTPEQIRRFFIEGRPLLERLCDLPFVNSAHDVLKTLEHLIPQEPAIVFTLIHRCVMAASRDAIQHEFMAAELVVELVERFLADHRDLFQRDAALRSKLMDVLDLFVEAGWPQAHHLTFRLDEAFR